MSEVARRRGDHEAEKRLLEEALDRYRLKGMGPWTRVVEERLARWPEPVDD